MIAMLAAAMIISRSSLHYTWRKTFRALAFPIALVTTALVFTIVYTGTKTAQLANGIAEAGRLGADNFNDVVDILRTDHVRPERDNEIRATLETIVAAAYWIGASLLLISLVASIRDMVFEFRHEVLLSLLERSDRKKTIRAIRRLMPLDEDKLLQDPVTSITALFAMGVEVVAKVGVHLKQAETATEFAQRVTAQVPACSGGLNRLAELFVRARYSPSSVSTEDVLLGRNALEELKACVRSLQDGTSMMGEQERRAH